MLMFALQLMFTGARKLYRIARTIYTPSPYPRLSRGFTVQELRLWQDSCCKVTFGRLPGFERCCPLFVEV